MAESYFLLAATFIPLLVAPLAYSIGRKAGINAATWFSFGALAVSTGLLLVPAMWIYNGHHQTYVETYKWGQFGDFGLRLDGLSLPFALIIYILCTVIALYSKPYMVHKVSEDLYERRGVDRGGGFSHGDRDHSDDSHPSSSTTNIEGGLSQTTTTSIV